MIDTRPLFIFGHIVTAANNAFSFDEGAAEIIAVMEPGGYSFEEYAFALQTALRDAGSQVYTVSTNRTAQTLTIAAPSAFTLRVATGTPDNEGYTLAGFAGANRSTVTTATSDSMSGLRYSPQFLIQSYVGSEFHQQAAFQVLNRSVSGREELIRFGVDKIIEMEIKFVSNMQMDGIVIRNDPNGVENTIEFMQYITQKQRFEFMPDENDLNDFEKVVLKSAPGFSDGTGYKLRELTDKNLRDIYDLGLIQLRVVG